MRLTRERHVCGVRVRAPAHVAETVLDLAAERIVRLLGAAGRLRANLASAGAELQLLGRDDAVTDLPMYRHLAGVPVVDGLTLDERGRGYGGPRAVVGEEVLLRLPSARHADHRDILAHELAHTVFDLALDDTLRARLRTRFARARSRWAGTYAASNAEEFFAELAMWWVGSRGDYGALAAPAEGRAWLRAHDPASAALLGGIFEGALAPRRLRWPALPAWGRPRSAVGGRPVRLLFANPHPDRPAQRWWLDPDGVSRPYGAIPPEGAVLQPTYAGHAWSVELPDGGRVGPFHAGATDARVVCA